MVLWPASPETVMLREPEIVSAPVVFARTPLSVVVRLTDATVVSFHFDNGWPAALKNAKLRVSVRPLLVTGGQSNLPVAVFSVHPLAGANPAIKSLPPVTLSETPEIPAGENWNPIVDSADPITSRSSATALLAVVIMAAIVSPAESCNDDRAAVGVLLQALTPMTSANAPAANARRFMFEFLMVVTNRYGGGKCGAHAVLRVHHDRQTLASFIMLTSAVCPVSATSKAQVTAERSCEARPRTPGLRGKALQIGFSTRPARPTARRREPVSGAGLLPRGRGPMTRGGAGTGDRRLPLQRRADDLREPTARVNGGAAPRRCLAVKG